MAAARDPDGDRSEDMARVSVTSQSRLNLPYYKMDANPRGKCVIINNYIFCREPTKPDAKSLPAREGTNVDRVEPDATEEVERRRLISNEGDFLVFYATVPGYVSWRSPSEGSWFIGQLTDLLDKYGHCDEIGEIMRGVNRDVGDRSTSPGQHKQAPVVMDALRKNLKFTLSPSDTYTGTVVTETSPPGRIS
ncbi:hypothetical protein BaRGS_00029235, partial [Batillaria attramentaria]